MKVLIDLLIEETANKTESQQILMRGENWST